jgi:hypothetical protein
MNTTIASLAEQAEQLSPDEQLLLIAHLANRVRQRFQTIGPPADGAIFAACSPLWQWEKMLRPGSHGRGAKVTSSVLAVMRF